MNDGELFLISIWVLMLIAAIIHNICEDLKPKRKRKIKKVLLEDNTRIFYSNGKKIDIGDLKIGDLFIMRDFDSYSATPAGETSQMVVTKEAEENHYGIIEIKAKFYYNNHKEMSIEKEFYYDEAV